MIDLHSHVLPGIDDGPRDLDGSVALARAAAAGGVRTLVATPHVREDHPGVRPLELAERTAALNAALTGAGVALEVVPGGEVDLAAALELPDEELLAARLGGGDTLLLETPYGPPPPGFEDLLGRVRERGVRLLLAHPERNPAFQREPERLAALVQDGVLIQVTAASLGARRSAPARRLAWTALRRGWAHALASDAHAVDWRPPDLGPASAAAERREPALAPLLRWLVTAAPAAILAGEDLPPRPEPAAAGPLARARGWLGR